MTMQGIAAALQRAQDALRRRPDMGLQDDAPATARWVRGTRVVASHAGGASITTDMPSELGGSGDQVSPGWVFRAGLAACTATRIAMAAATQGVDLTALDVQARSRSDARGMLGMPDAQGNPVDAGPRDVTLHVRIAARGIDAAALRALVGNSNRCSPSSCAMETAVPIELVIDIDAG
jgi:uncharacterized OsmC-like protein